MALKADAAAKRTYDQIIRCLKSTRQEAQLSQQALSSILPVNGKAVFEWEAGNIQPTMEHLLLWVQALERQLVIVGQNGELYDRPHQQVADEGLITSELRRLAAPLRKRRQERGVTLRELGERVGVAKESVQRWEAAHAAPRPLALIVWAQKLDLTITLARATDSCSSGL